MPNPIVFFDMTAGGRPVGRIEMEVRKAIDASVCDQRAQRTCGVTICCARGSLSRRFPPQQAFGAFTIVSGRSLCDGARTSLLAVTRPDVLSEALVSITITTHSSKPILHDTCIDRLHFLVP